MTHRRVIGMRRQGSSNARKVAILGALPVVVALAFSGTANATSVEHPVAQSESVVAPTTATPVVAISDPLPPGPDMNNVNNGAINGALVGAAAGAAVGGLGGAATGALAGAGTGLVAGVGAVLIPSVVVGTMGCLSTGCLVSVPAIVGGVIGMFLVPGPAMAAGAAVGAVAGGALGAAAVGIPAAAVGAAIGAGAGAAGVPMPAPPIPAL